MAHWPLFYTLRRITSQSEPLKQPYETSQDLFAAGSKKKESESDTIHNSFFRLVYVLAYVGTGSEKESQLLRAPPTP